MLEVKNLYKTYRSKTGVNVNAVNGISLKFNKTGLVFIVGKSGCGKSTLLNLLGGLDCPDGGEIIINGTSSFNFSQSDFDSYRNTYVGFVFQEYNLLKDFTVGANIALALELKGEKATENRINEILETVDLAGYGNRHINEISGGQKQRVAIARALVKNPEIILADEPSGALDSASAKSLFDTLKSLSKEKLVIVVSHDREFAFSYGDRVIEIKDGVVISDEEKVPVPLKENDDSLSFGKNEVIVPERYVLTLEDLTKINEYLQTAKGNTSIKSQKEIRTSEFKPFDSSKVEKETETFKPIKSSLPLKCAVKMGASNLGIKKFRLVLTILLSVISFTMFGLYDVMASFNKREATINSIIENKIEYASYKKLGKNYYDDNDHEKGYYLSNKRMTDDDISKIQNDTGVKMTGVFGSSLYFSDAVRDTGKLSDANNFFSYYPQSFDGLVELKDSPETYNLDFSIAGNESRVPTSFDEVAISQFSADVFLKFGFVDASGNEYEIEKYSDLVGKKINLSFEGSGERQFTIVGIYSTGSDYKKYEKLGEKISKMRDGNLNLTDQLQIMIEQNEFNDLKKYSFNNKAVVCDGYYEEGLNSGLTDFVFFCKIYYSYFSGSSHDVPPVIGFNSSAVKSYAKVESDKVHFFKEGKTTLDKDEVLVPLADLFDGSGNIITIDEKYEYRLGMGNYFDDDKTVKVVGYYEGDAIVFPDNLWSVCAAVPYDLCFGSFDGSRNKIEKLVDYSFNGEKNDEVYYSLVNHVTEEIELVTTLASVLKAVFIWVGVINAVFSALLLSNFIAAGVMNKKTEIGILRAIGARGIDVFKIFFSESGIIAGINFVLASILTGVFSSLLNDIFARSTRMIVTVMNFGIRQIGLLLLISLFVSAIASFLPVYKFAKKKPVDVILNK